MCRLLQINPKHRKKNQVHASNVVNLVTGILSACTLEENVPKTSVFHVSSLARKNVG